LSKIFFNRVKNSAPAMPANKTLHSSIAGPDSVFQGIFAVA